MRYDDRAIGCDDKHAHSRIRGALELCCLSRSVHPSSIHELTMTPCSTCHTEPRRPRRQTWCGSGGVRPSCVHIESAAIRCDVQGCVRRALGVCRPVRCLAATGRRLSSACPAVASVQQFVPYGSIRFASQRSQCSVCLLVPVSLLHTSLAVDLCIYSVSIYLPLSVEEDFVRSVCLYAFSMYPVRINYICNATRGSEISDHIE